MNLSVDVIDHGYLSVADLSELRQLFGSEYLRDFGEWDPALPYGYAPHEVHVIAGIYSRG